MGARQGSGVRQESEEGLYLMGTHLSWRESRTRRGVRAGSSTRDRSRERSALARKIKKRAISSGRLSCLNTCTSTGLRSGRCTIRKHRKIMILHLLH